MVPLRSNPRLLEPCLCLYLEKPSQFHRERKDAGIAEKRGFTGTRDFKGQWRNEKEKRKKKISLVFAFVGYDDSTVDSGRELRGNLFIFIKIIKFFETIHFKILERNIKFKNDSFRKF